MEKLTSVKSVFSPVYWILIATYLFLFVGLFYSSYTFMAATGWKRDDYTYCYLIPFVLLYLIWEKRTSLASLPSVPSWIGLVPFLFGLSLFWVGELGGEFLTLYISSWLVVVGLCWMHLGWEKLRAISFALIVMLTMFPLPNFLYQKVSFKLQLVSSQLAAAFMQLYGMSVYREGNIIDLGFTQLQVVDACSGLRYLFPLIVLGILLAYFFKAALWKRALIVISTVPLSIIANSLRIALTGILYEVWGAKVAERFFHGFSGWFIFMFSLAALLFEMWILSKVGGSHRPGGIGKMPQFHPSTIAPTYGAGGASLRSASLEVGEEKSQGTRHKVQGIEIENNTLDKSVLARRIHVSSPSATLKSETKQRVKAFFQPQFIVAIVLLGVTLALSQGIEFREKIPIKKSFDHFPLSLSEWTGNRQSMEQKFIDSLDFNDYVIITYKNRPGRDVNFYVAYYESQRKGKSIHSPASCLPGGGWIFNEAGSITLSIPGYNGGFMRVNRAFMEKSGYKHLSYYWFPQRGRILTNAYQLKMFAFWDALTKQRTDGALVRVITPVYEFEELEDAERRLRGFTREIVPVLEEYIPGRDIG